MVAGRLSAVEPCVRCGWRLFPVFEVNANGRCSCDDAACDSPGKHPRIVRWPSEATTDVGSLADWLALWPRTNWGVATGAQSGLVVLDEDPAKGGTESREALERLHGVLPDTVVQLTGGGGRHFLLRHPGVHVPTVAGVRPGLDVRGDGGFIVVAPSLHVSGRQYAWEIGYGPDDLPIAAAPAWLLALITVAGTSRLRRDGTPLVIRAGGRNDGLMRLGCALRRYGVSQTAILCCLEAINREHCEPPLDQDEVAKIAASAAHYMPAGAFHVAKVAVRGCITAVRVKR